MNTVAVLGAGTMGHGIAQVCAAAGIATRLFDTTTELVDKGLSRVRANLDKGVARGKVTEEAREATLGRLQGASDLATAVAGADMVIEAIPEKLELKQSVFNQVAEACDTPPIYATNTSSLSVDRIAEGLPTPERVIGTHFFNPVHIMKLLEVVRGAKTADDVLATVMNLSKKIKKVAVVAGVCHGFIGNRMLMPRQVEANKLLMEGATPEQIDRVHVEFGMPMGPFQMSDLAGVDIGWHRDPSRIESIRDALCAEDRWGQKKGAGFYDYDEKRNPTPSARVAEIIEDFRSRSNMPKREISDQEIIERTLYTMVNEGAMILEEGMAQRASDIDVVWIYGYGWPVYRGGPMFWAGLEGTPKIVEGLKKHGFAVSPLLAEKAEKNEGF